MSKIGIVIGVKSAYSFVFVNLESTSEAVVWSGTVVNFRGDPLTGKLDNDSTELSICDVKVLSPSIGGDPRA
jgi:hypothetical protein